MMQQQEQQLYLQLVKRGHTGSLAQTRVQELAPVPPGFCQLLRQAEVELIQNKNATQALSVLTAMDAVHPFIQAGQDFRATFECAYEARIVYVDVLTALGRVEDATTVLARMPDHQNRYGVLWRRIRQLMQCGKYLEATARIQDIKNPNRAPSTHTEFQQQVYRKEASAIRNLIRLQVSAYLGLYDVVQAVGAVPAHTEDAEYPKLVSELASSGSSRTLKVALSYLDEYMGVLKGQIDELIKGLDGSIMTPQNSVKMAVASKLLDDRSSASKLRGALAMIMQYKAMPTVPQQLNTDKTVPLLKTPPRQASHVMAQRNADGVDVDMDMDTEAIDDKFAKPVSRGRRGQNDSALRDLYDTLRTEPEVPVEAYLA